MFHVKAEKEEAAALWDKHRAAQDEQLAVARAKLEAALQEGSGAREALQELQLEAKQQVCYLRLILRQVLGHPYKATGCIPCAVSLLLAPSSQQASVLMCHSCCCCCLQTSMDHGGASATWRLVQLLVMHILGTQSRVRFSHKTVAAAELDLISCGTFGQCYAC